MHPSEQSQRLEATVHRARTGDAAALEALADIDIDFSKVSEITRLSVSLDAFAEFTSLEGSFKKAGWISENHNLAPCVSYANLRCVLEILERPSFIMHYISERSRQQRAIEIHGDEIDWLGLYLDTLFNFSALEEEGPSLVITGMSEDLDQYYQLLEAGKTPAKPKVRLSPLWRKVIHGIEERRFDGWSIAALALLRSASRDEQKGVEKEFKRVCGIVRKNWQDPEHTCSVIVTPPSHRNASIVFFAYPNELNEKRHETARILAGQAFEIGHVERCVLIGKNISKGKYPYSFVSIFTRP